MNIIEAKKVYNTDEQLEKFMELEKFYKKNGNDVTAGYINDATAVRFDEKNNIEFQSLHFASNLKTLSTGTLLDNGVVINQIQRNEQKSYFQIFSWNKDYDTYTYLLFDDLDSMIKAYNTIKDANCNLCDENLVEKLKDLKIPIDNILKANQTKVEDEDFLAENPVSYDDAEPSTTKII